MYTILFTSVDIPELGIPVLYILHRHIFYKRAIFAIYFFMPSV